MFQGFSQGAVDFLWGVRFNNERSWFEAHKQEYLDLVIAPLQELGRQVHAAMTAAYPKEQLNLYVSRIYRDARRLHGRGPYKDHLWFTIRPEQEGWTHVPAFYFEIAPEYHSLGMGYYGAEPVTMAKFRSRIDRDPAPMEKLARRLSRQHRFVLEGALSLVQPEKHRPDLGPQLRGLPVHPRAGWGGGGELPLPQALLRLLSLPPWRPSPGCLPLIPAAPGIAPGGRILFENFYIFPTKPLDIPPPLWYIIARKDESNVLRSLIDQMSLPQTRGCVTCIKSFPDVSGSRR